MLIQHELFSLDDTEPVSRQHIIDWMVLDAIPNLPKRTIFKLLSKHGLAELLHLPLQQLQNYHFKDLQIAALLNPNMHQIEANLSWLAEDANKYIICFDDARYPAQLKEISSPPLLLYLHGDIGLLKQPQIALVGSRNCSYYGKEKAYQFSADLCARGFVITSGLALGIDGYAHQGALDSKGKTIAVLGTGLNNIYPKRHLQLAKQISDTGLLVSEFWPDCAAMPSNFPRRNRLISGLSLGVLVIEASQRSGSLITARYALEQNRELFALPGSIDNPEACGCHQLIQQGAKLVVGSEDIAVEFKHLLSCESPIAKLSSKEPQTDHPLLEYIDFHNTTLEQLLERSGLALVNLQNQLIELEITDRITVTTEGYSKGKSN